MYINDNVQTNALYNVGMFHELRIGKLMHSARNQSYYDAKMKDMYTLVLVTVTENSNHSSTVVDRYSMNTAFGPMFHTKKEAHEFYCDLIEEMNRGITVIELSTLIRRNGYVLIDSVVKKHD